MILAHDRVIDFWFHDIDSKSWWKKDHDFDQQVRDLFFETLQQAINDELTAWRDQASGRLAEIIVLDQFSRNIFRDRPEAFAQDDKALQMAQEAVQLGCDLQLPATQRAFLYMPYMHSESPAVHEEAVRLFSAPGLEGNLEFELKHKQIIDRFGRYPHRNAVLGRPSTAEEQAFLQQPGSSF